MAAKLLAGLRVVSFEARRADELATMLARHGAEVVRAPALREERLAASPEALELARRLEAGEVDLVVLLTGVGTRALVDRKSTRLNSSHRTISYAVFCLKKKKQYQPAD